MGSQMAPQMNRLDPMKPMFETPQMQNPMQSPMQNFVGSPISGGLDGQGSMLRGPYTPEQKDDIRRRNPRRARRGPRRRNENKNKRPRPSSTGTQPPPGVPTMSSPSIMMY